MPKLTAEQFPLTGPYALAGSGKKSKGPTAEALKRAMSRLGKLPWREFDQHYNRDLERALDSWDPGGANGYGEGRWEKIRGAVVPRGLDHAGEFALDFYAIKLVQDEAGSSGTTDEEVVRGFITEWWTIAAANESLWDYDATFRPVPLDEAAVMPKPSRRRKADCSSTVIIARRYAEIKSGLILADPAKQNWTGYGNTDRFMDDWPKIAGPFRVGDLAHFFSERHVIECVAAGDFLTARWGSNGTGAGPVIFRLPQYGRFPSEYLFTVRPDLVIA